MEYPYKEGGVLLDSSGLQPPKQLHPIFYGCFDWHRYTQFVNQTNAPSLTLSDPSAVHGHWLLARAAALHPSTQLEQDVTRMFDEQFTEEKVGFSKISS